MREQPIRDPRKERGKEKGKKRGKKRKKERRKEPCSTPKEFSGKQKKKKIPRTATGDLFYPKIHKEKQ